MTVRAAGVRLAVVREWARFRAAVGSWAAGGDAVAALELASGELTTVVLVEGISDQNAVEALAARRHRDLAGEGVCVLPIGGAMAIGRYLPLFGAGGLAVRFGGCATRRRRAGSDAVWSRPASAPT